MPDFKEQARRLGLGAVEVLPEGLLLQRLEEGRPLRAKLGIDPTAPDIHLGHTVVLEKLRQFQELGHTVVLIIGDYTARVGDPTGRSDERPVLSEEQIDANAATFTEQAFKVLDRELTEIRFNSEWLDMPSGELFQLARRFTVARLLERDDFTKRMAASQPISALELLYPVLQGYDSVAVEADIELGGTDQKFNLLFGRDVQEAYGMRPQAILTMPILPGTDGKRRMSKSTGNYVGVTDEPAEMFGKLMSLPDEALETYYTLLLGEEIDPDAHKGKAKRALASKLCDRFHGDGAGRSAEERFDSVHVRKEIPDDIETLAIEGGGEVHLPALIADAFAISRGEARRMIGQGAVRIDGEQISGDSLDLAAAELTGKVLQVGKRRFVRVSGGS